MSSVHLERLRREGQALMEAVSREHYRAHAGLQAEARLQPIYERHREIVGGDALALVREMYDGAPDGSSEQRSGRLLLEWQAELVAQRALAAHDEREIAWESNAVARLDDGTAMPYQRLGIAIANASDRNERMALERARSTLVESELAPLRRERLARERELVQELGLASGVVPTFSRLMGIDLEALARECDLFLADTEALWQDQHPRFVRARLGIDPRTATRADALSLFRAPEFDGHFTPGGAEERARLHFGEAGLDVDAGGRIVHDTGEREGKRARAFCAPVRIPDEVYLVLRPHGGASDWRTYMHELGHALHFGYASASLPFEFRWLGDNSITEGYAMLLDHLLQEPSWLRRYTGLSGDRLSAFLRSIAFEELHFLRRYSAKLRYELMLYDERTPLDDMPGTYAELLGSATTFRYDPGDAFVDVDARFYSARYLRAWQLQAALRDALFERFDEDWFRNPRAGEWLREALFAHGQRELAEDLAARVAGTTLRFEPLVRRIESLFDSAA